MEKVPTDGLMPKPVSDVTFRGRIAHPFVDMQDLGLLAHRKGMPHREGHARARILDALAADIAHQKRDILTGRLVEDLDHGSVNSYGRS
jgi:hypothetical protein